MNQPALQQLDAMNLLDALAAIDQLIAGGAERSPLLKALREQAPQVYEAWLARMASR